MDYFYSNLSIGSGLLLSLFLGAQFGVASSARSSFAIGRFSVLIGRIHAIVGDADENGQYEHKYEYECQYSAKVHDDLLNCVRSFVRSFLSSLGKSLYKEEIAIEIEIQKIKNKTTTKKANELLKLLKCLRNINSSNI